MSMLARIFLSLIIICSQPSTGLLAIGIQLATVSISQNSLSLIIVHLLNYHKMAPYGFNKGNRRACLCFDTLLTLFAPVEFCFKQNSYVAYQQLRPKLIVLVFTLAYAFCTTGLYQNN